MADETTWKRVRVIHLSDIHVGPDDQVPVQEVYERLKKLTVQLGVDGQDVYLVAGNHDADYGAAVQTQIPTSLSKVHIEHPFGSLVMRVLALARPTKIETSALAQTIEDTRHEINEALAAGRDEQVRRLKFRGWLLLVWMVILELASAAAAIRRLIG